MAAPNKGGVITRRDFECPIFGNPRDLLSNKLPTTEDVLRCCFQERYNLAIQINNKSVPFTKVAATVANKVKLLYDKASIPTVTDYRVVQLINANYDMYGKLRKSYNRDKNKPPFKLKIDEFKQKCSLLFDIAACKCPIVAEDCKCNKNLDACVCPIHANCVCEKEKKIPALELRFMYLQRNYGIGKIGSLDLKETNRNINKMKRKNYERKRSELTGPLKNDEVLLEVSDSEVSDNSDQEFEPKPSTSTSRPQWQMRVSLKTTAITSDRYGVSDRATAAIASSVLQDIGVITESDNSYVVDKNKVRREKFCVRSNLQSKKTDEVYGLYFDGRRDSTLVIDKAAGKQFRRTTKEEHYSLIQEPGSIYIDHTSPSSNSSTDIANSITACLSERDVSLDNLEVIGCDGTVTNTGWKTGVIRQIELKVGRPLQWSICLLHFNELPFRHLFQFIDGTTTGPAGYAGPIGKVLPGCEKLPVVEFQPISCEIPDVDRNLLSKDQLYLLDISNVIQSGNCSEDFSVRDPGPMSHSRWLTTANRVLRLYISMERPSENLMKVVNFIMKSYMPMWFSIKVSKNFTDGPKHVYRTIETTRYLPEELLKVVDPVIQRNAYFAHPENILLAMVTEERNHIRELGYRRILKARQEDRSECNHIRYFKPPKLNFDARDYTEIIHWDECQLTPPPLLRALSNEDIKEFVSGDCKSKPVMEFKKFPCHTQSVERCVKLVTEASSKVCGHSARDGFIRATLLSRSSMPTFSNKSQFKAVVMNKNQ